MLKVSAPEMVSGVSGESEQKLRELFDLAVVRLAFILLGPSQFLTLDEMLMTEKLSGLVRGGL